MSSAPKNPDDVAVPQPSDPAGAAISDAAVPAVPPVAGNGSGAVSSDAVMASTADDPTPSPDRPGAPQPPASPDPQGAPPPPPPGAPQPPPAGQPPAAAPGYFQDQGVPPQQPPGYPGYPQPGGPYERRGLRQAWQEYPALRWLLVILVLAVAALLVWLLAFKSDGSSTATVQPGGGPVGATEQDLVALSQRLNQPIYWAGNVAGTRMELTETSSSYAYLRYLTSDAPIGDSSANFLTIGTYPSTDAYRNLTGYANNSRAKTVRIQNGGIAVVVPHSPTSVYFAYPNQDVQVEVYDPQAGGALDMVKSGQVSPVPGGVTTSTGAAVPAVPSQTTPGSVTTTPTTTPATPTAPVTTVPGG